MTATHRRMPAEWEPQRCIQLTWPHAHTDWAPMLEEITAVYQEMKQVIERFEPVLVVDDIPHNDTWARDHGFITVDETCEAATRRLLLDFCFNGWGEKFAADLDNQINRRLYERSQQPATTERRLLSGSYEAHLDFVLEGGSIESDGRGTIFTTTGCLLAPHRNQPLTRPEIDRRLRQWLGAERIVWIDHGALLGDDTDGHIDTIVRICPDDTILYTAGDNDHPDLLLMEQQLEGLRTLQGCPYRLLRLPLPRPIYDGGERLPATYANFLVVNGAVLVPTYQQPDLDAQAMDMVAKAYPDREIIGIDCRQVIRQHGSLHCCTMQYY